MTATQLQSRPDAPGADVRKLNETAARQVSEILEQAGQRDKARKPAMVYRVPMAGVRYYF